MSRAAGQAHAAKIGPAFPLRNTARVAAPAGTSRVAYRFGRVGVFAIPVLAVLAVIGGRAPAAFSLDPVIYQRYLSHGRFSPMGLLTGLGTGVVTIIALLALVAVLVNSGARRIAITGAVLGIIGAMTLMIEVGTVIVRVPRAAGDLFSWRLSDIAINQQTRGLGAAVVVLGAAALLAIGWMLIGYAVFRTAGFNQGDGGLLGLSGPTVFFGGFLLATLPTMGAFLLGAAGLGIIFGAGRVGRARGPLTTPARAPRAPVTSFAPFADPEAVSGDDADLADGIVDGVDGVDVADADGAQGDGSLVGASVGGESVSGESVGAAAVGGAAVGGALVGAAVHGGAGHRDSGANEAAGGAGSAARSAVGDEGSAVRAAIGGAGSAALSAAGAAQPAGTGKHAGSPTHGAHAGRPSSLRRLSRGISTAWPVTKARFTRNAAPAKDAAKDGGASVKPVAVRGAPGGASAKGRSPNGGGHAATPSSKAVNAGTTGVSVKNKRDKRSKADKQPGASAKSRQPKKADPAGPLTTPRPPVAATDPASGGQPAE